MRYLIFVNCRREPIKVCISSKHFVVLLWIFIKLCSYNRANLKKLADFCTCTVDFCRPILICSVTYWDKRYSQKLCHLRTEETHAKCPAKSPVSDLPSGLVNYHPQTVRLYSSNLLCLTNVCCHRSSETRLCTRCPLVSSLETSWAPVRDTHASVKFELSYTVYSYVWNNIPMPLYSTCNTVATCWIFDVFVQ